MREVLLPDDADASEIRATHLSDTPLEEHLARQIRLGTLTPVVAAAATVQEVGIGTAEQTIAGAAVSEELVVSLASVKTDAKAGISAITDATRASTAGNDQRCDLRPLIVPSVSAIGGPYPRSFGMRTVSARRR